MTCSARLPIYTLIIAAVIPNDDIGGGIGLQGLVLFALYFAGIFNALVIAAILRLTVTRGGAQSFLMELPKYQLPALRDLGLGLLSRAKSFLMRAGTTILIASVVLWVLASYPAPPEGATEPAIYYSFAAMIGRGLSYVFAPVGFTWEMCVALVPGMAAREVAVGALGTVYALSGSGDSLTAEPGRDAAQCVVAADRAGLPRLVRLRADVLLDAGGVAARDQFPRLDGVPVRVSDGAGLCRRGRHLLDCPRIRVT